MRARFINWRLVNWRYVGPLLGELAVAAGVIMGAIYLERHNTKATPSSKTIERTQTGNELVRELAHCQNLGQRAEDDHDCLAAWSENRRRFFGSAVPNSAPPNVSQSQSTSHR
ncbi:MAG: putative entry exclusion protein TrbK-alt [Rhizomicrobium sp.]